MRNREIAELLIVPSVGYQTTVGPTDRGKVEKARLGLASKSCSARLGEAARQLYMSDPETEPGPAPNPDLAAIWNADAVMMEGGLSNFHGDARARAYATGWRVIETQLLHTGYAAANEAEIPVFTREGWVPVGWGTYGQDTDPYADGRTAAGICNRLTFLRGWKANGEAWAEGALSWKTAEFLRGWRDGGGRVPLGWSVLSSDTANYAREFDYPTALSVQGADIDVQVYGATVPTYTVAAANGMLDKAGVPPSRRAITFDLAGNGGGPFADYRTWKGPRRLFNDGRATVESFNQLAR